MDTPVWSATTRFCQPADLPAQTPIEVRFKYEENGRLTVMVSVEGTKKQLKHEITRENSLTQDQLDSWRKYISGLDPAATPEPAHLSKEVRTAPPTKAIKETLDYSPEVDLDKPGNKTPDPGGSSPSGIKRRWN